MDHGNGDSGKGPPPDSSSEPLPIEKLARAVLDRCMKLGSRDNMTIVLADLRPKPKRNKPPNPSFPSSCAEQSSEQSMDQSAGNFGKDVRQENHLLKAYDDGKKTTLLPPAECARERGELIPAPPDGSNGNESSRVNAMSTANVKLGMNSGGYTDVRPDPTAGGRQFELRSDREGVVTPGDNLEGNLETAEGVKAIDVVTPRLSLFNGDLGVLKTNQGLEAGEGGKTVKVIVPPCSSLSNNGLGALENDEGARCTLGRERESCGGDGDCAGGAPIFADTTLVAT